MKLTCTEIKFMSLIWDNEPISSGKLVTLCAEKFGWKKSTTYTFLKRLQERGVVTNIDATVTALVKREAIQRIESKDVMETSFEGSLPKFVTAFLSDKKLSKKEIDELKELLDNYKE
ncbi:BlaI/MecI/CopY family transcriptional regulator [Anaerorhabdus sp.]|uniref:BlaI/MecI/CopY family transcriptional regulator n=1 Tax=Anaerorhabdus sp. TaxID=1872524 RepID=UPI002B1FA0D4|nr:BlaI/MecI/CopY family transcriptional regulator [Anaerorhabdus sp.]MEA4875421.1 BlaI/MecI/CopY family transcriptional regulator [Anaerorhabdus sp.]